MGGRSTSGLDREGPQGVTYGGAQEGVVALGTPQVGTETATVAGKVTPRVWEEIGA